MTREELIRHARAMYECSQTPESVKSALEEEFPELKGSEDDKEKIRQNGRLDVCYNPEKYGLCHKVEWSEEDERIMDNCIEYIKASCLDAHDLNECIDFIKSLRPQSHKWYIKKGHWYMCIVDKPEYGWTKGKVYQSPEDNRIETNYKGSLTNWPDKEPWFRPATRSEIPDNQPHWKPSDEQLRPLEYAIDYFKKKGNDTTYLESLLNDLNKL